MTDPAHPAAVSETTENALEQFAPIYADEYKGFKQDLLSWLRRRGKKPFRGDGYAPDTVKTTHYKIERTYRWKWEQDGFTKQFTPDDADTFIDHLVRDTEMQDREVRDYIKSIKRLFKWFNKRRGANFDWEYHRLSQLRQQGESKRQHYFEQYEMAALYDAAIEYGAIPSYYSVTPDERDRLKAVLAQRLHREKGGITAKDFEGANSWKYPSIIAISIDLGLRPIEIKRSTTDWLRLTDQKVCIPREEGAKENDPWECALSSRAVRAAQHWLKERKSYEKYDDRDEIWLTQQGNPYESYSLNGLLTRLKDKTEIEPRGRKLTWYSIRRGAATMWTAEADLAKAASQLRHKKLETTRRYRIAKAENRKQIADDMW